jgi:hypothetical protein
MTHNSVRYWHYENAPDGEVLWHVRELRKMTISFGMSDRASVSVRKEQLSSHWTEFHEILYWRPLLKSAGKIQVLLKSSENIGHYLKTSICLWQHFAEFFPDYEILSIKFAEELKTYFVSNIFPRKLCLLQGNYEKYSRARQVLA